MLFRFNIRLSNETIYIWRHRIKDANAQLQTF